MKLKIYIFLILIGIACFASLAFADEMHPVYKGSKAFQQMKQLAGSWSGTIDMGKGPQKIDAKYHVTSSGSALVETVFAGTPHEMVTVYYDDKKGRLRMTHYCGLNNQPQMILVANKDKRLKFDLDPKSSLNSSTDEHMHSLNIVFVAKDKVRQEWTQFANGKKEDVTVISFERLPK